MIVRELIEQLQEIEDQESLVLMSSDAEGNSESPLQGITPVVYWDDSKKCMTYDEDAKKSIILWPED